MSEIPERIRKTVGELPEPGRVPEAERLPFATA